MSKELQGHGEIVGSPEYFNKLNSTGIIEHIIIDRNKYDYYDSLKNTADEINEVFDEVLEDLRENASVMRYISKENRDSLIGLINELNEVCKITNSASERAHYCISILQISSDLTSYKSYASESEIDNSVNTIERNPFSLSKDSVLELLQKAINNGISSVTWDNEQNEKLLTELSPNGQLPDQNFLKDVYAKSRYFNRPYEYTGSCGRALCSNDYQDYIIQSVFGTTLSRDTKFGTQIIEDLRSIAKNISDDLNYGILHKDYVKDENAGRLKEAIKELDRCDISCSGLIDKVDELSWHVGGDPAKIEQLQHLLNELEMPGPSGHLLEDGVYGKETLGAWEKFLNNLTHGSVPSLNWINPLQTKSTNVGIGDSIYGVRNALVNVKDVRPKAPQYLRVDPPHTVSGKYRGNKIPIDYNHVNVFDKPTNAAQGRINYWYNHYPLSDDAYAFLKNFDNVAKKVEVGGKVLLVIGLALDALEIGLTVYDDLNDVDKKLGKKTASASARFFGRWGGSIGGAKLGAWGGATIGTAIAPGVGTVIGGAVGGLILGIVGAFAGDKLAEYVIDITPIRE